MSAPEPNVVHYGDPVIGFEAMQYGAKCDGTNDDSGPIRSAIAAACVTNGIARLPSGTCMINTGLTMPDSGCTVTLQGAGFEQTFLKAGAAMSTMITKGANNLASFSIKDMTLNANRLADECVDVPYGKGGIIDRVKCYRFLHRGFVFGVNGGALTAQAYEWRVTRSTIDGDSSILSGLGASFLPEYGIVLYNGGTDNMFSDVVITYPQTAGVLFSAGSGNFLTRIHIYDNFSVPTYGMQVLSPGNMITESDFDGIPGIGIYLGDNNNVVSNNVFYWSTLTLGAQAISVASALTDNIISGNTFRGADTATTQIAFDESSTAASVSNAVFGNSPSLNSGSQGSAQWNLIGGSMEIGKGSAADVRFRITADRSHRSELVFMEKTAGSNSKQRRWILARNEAVESGSNVGSDFTIDRYDDSNVLLGTAWTIERSTGIVTQQQSVNTAFWKTGQASELLTLSTSGTTTDTSANLLPANSIIEAVVARITTTIVTATDWKLGDGTQAARFTNANATLTAGTVTVGLNHQDPTVASSNLGPVQTSAAKVRVTTTGTPSAGAIRITVFYRQFQAPQS